MPHPFLGLGFNTWTEKFGRSNPLAFLEYTTVLNTSLFTLRSSNSNNSTYEVDWGDGNTDSYTNTPDVTHTYSTAGEYTIKITPAEGDGYVPNYQTDVAGTSIASVTGTGGSQLGTSFQDAFRNVNNMTSFSGTIDTSTITKFYRSWGGCTSLTSFPLIDTSSGNNFQWTWSDCSSLTSFPDLDFSSGFIFRGSWIFCSQLTSFPANMFDTTATLTTNAFWGSWRGCALTAQSIENILVSLDTNGQSNIELGIDQGTNAAKTTWSTAANTAYDNLITKGWTISYNA